jgi:hypothetical protein
MGARAIPPLNSQLGRLTVTTFPLESRFPGCPGRRDGGVPVLRVPRAAGDGGVPVLRVPAGRASLRLGRTAGRASWGLGRTAGRASGRLGRTAGRAGVPVLSGGRGWRSAGSPWRQGMAESRFSLAAGDGGVPVLSGGRGWRSPGSLWRRGMAECRFSRSSGRGRIRNSRRSERVQGAADSSIEPDWKSESVCRRIPRIR